MYWTFAFFLAVATAHAQPRFLWGTATAAYQVEGAPHKDGKSESIWDVFSHIPGKTYKNQTGDLADDEYDRFLEDVNLMSDMGVNTYRFSLAWPRIIPDGHTVNPQGIMHYQKLFDALEAKNIIPFVTLYHWDIPQVLDATMGGWLNESIVQFYSKYARTCFEAFGNRVKHWITFNEPSSFCLNGYLTGIHAPGRCSNRSQCDKGNSTTEPYMCAHHVLLSHAAVTNMYHKEFEPSQKGVIGMTLNGDWGEPMSSKQEDKDAAERWMIYYTAWWADPIFLGDYPSVMKQAAGSLMPSFTAEQKQMLKGSSDFYGMNEYSAKWVAFKSNKNVKEQTWATFQENDIRAVNYNGTAIGAKTDTPWLYVVPTSIKNMLLWVSQRYSNPPIYVTENGMDCVGEGTAPLPQVLNDTCRSNFFEGYLTNLQEARKQGAVVRGYFAWSLMDNFEWSYGYDKRFGFIYIDRENNLARHPKNSFYWYKKYVAAHPY